MSGLRGSVSYSYSFKMRVVNEVLSGSISKTDARRKYGIAGHSTISKWIRKLDDKYPEKMKNRQLDKSQYELRIRELEKALEIERLRSEAYEQMIKIAEEELKIKIRKKYNTKRSKK